MFEFDLELWFVLENKKREFDLVAFQVKLSRR